MDTDTLITGMDTLITAGDTTQDGDIQVGDTRDTTLVTDTDTTTILIATEEEDLLHIMDLEIMLPETLTETEVIQEEVITRTTTHTLTETQIILTTEEAQTQTVVIRAQLLRTEEVQHKVNTAPIIQTEDQAQLLTLAETEATITPIATTRPDHILQVHHHHHVPQT
jgi:hypothetical protein